MCTNSVTDITGQSWLALEILPASLAEDSKWMCHRTIVSRNQWSRQDLDSSMYLMSNLHAYKAQIWGEDKRDTKRLIICKCRDIGKQSLVVKAEEIPEKSPLKRIRGVEPTQSRILFLANKKVMVYWCTLSFQSFAIFTVWRPRWGAGQKLLL